MRYQGEAGNELNPVSEPGAIVSFEQTRRIGPSGDNAAGIQREQIAVIIALHSL